MKKRLIATLSVIALLFGVTSAFGNAADSTPYTIIVPLEYDDIIQIYSDTFIAVSVGETRAKYNLYRFDGTLLIEDIWDIAAIEGFDGIQDDDKWRDDVRGDVFIDIDGNGDEFYPTDVTRCAAYNKEGQLLLDFLPYYNNRGYFYRLESGSYGRFIYGYNVFGNYIFTGRGRLIASRDTIPYYGMMNGKYIHVFDFYSGQHIMDRNGDVVIESGVFDTYRFNCANDVIYTRVSDYDEHVIVSKNGRYGVITINSSLSLPAYNPDEAEHAVEKGIIPEDIQLWWLDNCTREEFCRMLMLVYESATGNTVDELQSSPLIGYLDCDEPSVVAATALGIVNGIGGHLFAPDRFITREESAVILARAARLLGVQPMSDNVDFDDSGAFEDWSRDEIIFVSQFHCSTNDAPLMQGIGEYEFMPKDKYTVDQAALSLLHLLELTQNTATVGNR